MLDVTLESIARLNDDDSEAELVRCGGRRQVGQYVGHGLIYGPQQQQLQQQGH